MAGLFLLRQKPLGVERNGLKSEMRLNEDTAAEMEAMQGKTKAMAAASKATGAVLRMRAALIMITGGEMKVEIVPMSIVIKAMTDQMEKMLQYTTAEIKLATMAMKTETKATVLEMHRRHRRHHIAVATQGMVDEGKTTIAGTMERSATLEGIAHAQGRGSGELDRDDESISAALVAKSCGL